ncbi:MAG: hypothetical protein J7K11_03700 [Candidatus Hydrothermae bacterium]|nr:hypothetical protein [Candidatus Hydrothermae bacterium]
MKGEYMHYYNLKIVIFTVIAIIAQKAFCQAHQIDITSYDVIVNWDLRNNNLHITAKLELKEVNFIDEFKMLLNTDATIMSIKCTINNDQINIPYYFVEKDTLNLIVPPELKSKEELTIDFDYTLPVNTLKNGMVFLRREDRWYPLQYDDIARWRVVIQIPNGYIAFSVGNLEVKEIFPEYLQFIWESEKPLPSFPLIIAKSESITKTVKNIDSKNINFYFSSKDTEIVKEIIAETCDAFKFYNELIGEYEHNQLTLIEIPDAPFVQSLSTIIMIGSPFIHYFNKGLNEWPSHEVAHQWCGAGMYVKSDTRGRWFIEESLTEYFRLMYLEKTKGENTLNEALQSKLEKYKSIAGTEKDVPIIDIKYPMKESGIVIYKKGPYIMHKVRSKIGKENWCNFIKEIYRNYKGRFFTYDEFKKYLSIYDEDGSCTLMLEKWVTKTGMPEDQSD